MNVIRQLYFSPDVKPSHDKQPKSDLIEICWGRRGRKIPPTSLYNLSRW